MQVDNYDALLGHINNNYDVINLGIIQSRLCKNLNKVFSVLDFIFWKG